MGKPRLQKDKIRKIISLRQEGHTLPEIQNVVGCAKATIQRYIKDVTINESARKKLAYRIAHRQKYASEVAWGEAREQANKILGTIDARDRLVFLSGLYWGEGTKKELNVINGDPDLMKSILQGLYLLGVQKSDIRIAIRLFGEDTKSKATKFWLKKLKLSSVSVVGYEVLKKTNGNGPLKFGMCRLRVVRGGKFFKQIISMIDLLGTRGRPDSSMDRALHS